MPRVRSGRSSLGFGSRVCFGCSKPKACFENFDTGFWGLWGFICFGFRASGSKPEDPKPKGSFCHRNLRYAQLFLRCAGRLNSFTEFRPLMLGGITRWQDLVVRRGLQALTYMCSSLVLMSSTKLLLASTQLVRETCSSKNMGYSRGTAPEKYLPVLPCRGNCGSLNIPTRASGTTTCKARLRPHVSWLLKTHNSNLGRRTSSGRA